MLLGVFDPSLKATGCALLTDRPGSGGRSVLDVAKLEPPAVRTLDRYTELTGRLVWLSEAVLERCCEWDVDEVVVEVPGMHPPRWLNKKRKTVAGQARYGSAVGSAVSGSARWLVAKSGPGFDGVLPVYGVQPEEWTRGRGKAARRDLLTLLHPAARATLDAAGGDAGMDMADAVELGLWWLGGGRTAYLARSA